MDTGNIFSFHKADNHANEMVALYLKLIPDKQLLGKVTQCLQDEQSLE